MDDKSRTVGSVARSMNSAELQSTLHFSVDHVVVGRARFDTQAGRLQHLWTEVATTSTAGPLYGHTRFMALMTPFEEGPIEPADMPKSSFPSL